MSHPQLARLRRLAWRHYTPAISYAVVESKPAPNFRRSPDISIAVPNVCLDVGGTINGADRGLFFWQPFEWNCPVALLSRRWGDGRLSSSTHGGISLMSTVAAAP